MSHTGGKEGTYPGTRASATMIGDDETNWAGDTRHAIYRSTGHNIATVGCVPQRQLSALAR